MLRHRLGRESDVTAGTECRRQFGNTLCAPARSTWPLAESREPPFDTTLLAAGDLACMQVSPLRHAARIAAMLMSVIVTAGLLSLTRSQLLGCAGGISHLLLAPCAFRTYLLYRHGE